MQSQSVKQQSIFLVQKRVNRVWLKVQMLTEQTALKGYGTSKRRAMPKKPSRCTPGFSALDAALNAPNGAEPVVYGTLHG